MRNHTFSVFYIKEINELYGIRFENFQEVLGVTFPITTKPVSLVSKGDLTIQRGMFIFGVSFKLSLVKRFCKWKRDFVRIH